LYIEFRFGITKILNRSFVFTYYSDVMQKKSVTVSLETWRELTKIKADLNAESLDVVIKELLKKWKQ